MLYNYAVIVIIIIRTTFHASEELVTWVQKETRSKPLTIIVHGFQPETEF